jgi:hypothetical protein
MNLSRQKIFIPTDRPIVSFHLQRVSKLMPCKIESSAQRLQLALSAYLKIISSRESPYRRLSSCQGFGKVYAHSVFATSECRWEKREHPKENSLSSSRGTVHGDIEHVVVIRGRLCWGELERKLFPCFRNTFHGSRCKYCSLGRFEGNRNWSSECI